MDSSLLATKLFIPPARPGLIERPRLIERMRAALSSSLILVSAPAGSGKTTLVSDWIRQNQEQTPAAWVSLDEGDNDPVRFWDYFVAAVKTLQPTAGENALTLLHAPQPYPTEAMLTALINDLINTPNDFAIVLDDYHLIKNEAVQTGIIFLLDQLPPRMHLVVATRTDPPLTLAHFRGRRTMLEIGEDDLRFTDQETAELFEEMQNIKLSSEDVRAINDRTEGWAVGLTMAALSISKQKDIPGFIATFTGSQRYVMDYLVEEVLKVQSDDVKDFWLKTSVLERLTAPLCNSITGRSDSQTTLEILERANLFLIPLDESRQWYRYHHLFADLLRHQLEVKSGVEGAVALHKQASKWYEDNNFTDDAVRHAMAARDWERAGRLIGSTVDRLAKLGEWKVLLDWFQLIPEDSLRADPRLYAQYANVLTLHGQLDAAESALDYLETKSREDPALQGELAFFRTILATRRSDDALTEEFAQKALALLRPDNLEMRARANFHLGMLQIRQAHLEEARSLFSEAFELGRQVADYWITAGASAYIGQILWLRGKLSEALAAAQQAVDLAGHSPAAALPR